MCHYETLGVSRTASAEEIKQAYKRLVLQSHPDKSRTAAGSCSDIYVLNEAYRVLKDNDARVMYDAEMAFASVNFDTQASTHMLIGLLGQLFEQTMHVFADVLRERKRASAKPTVVPRDITLYVPISIEDLFHMRVKKVVIKRLTVDEGEKNTALFISLVNYEPRHVFQGQGDYGGDAIVILDILEHPVYSIGDKYDLHVLVKVDLWTYYYVGTTQIDHLDGKCITLDIPRAGDAYYAVKSLEGRGIPHYDVENDVVLAGDLYVRFQLALPRLGTETLSCDRFRKVLSLFKES